jgi:hypothetical protein
MREVNERELTRALAFQRYRNLATLERARKRPMIQRMTTAQWAQQIRNTVVPLKAAVGE